VLIKCVVCFWDVKEVGHSPCVGLFVVAFEDTSVEFGVGIVWENEELFKIAFEKEKIKIEAIWKIKNKKNFFLSKKTQKHWSTSTKWGWCIDTYC
jgi:hypothetical protein